MRSAAVFLSVLGAALAAPAADEILSLPGWDGALPSRQYSGYLTISSTKHLHYWFVESENDPVNDPVVLWLNGGPGCSSLGGFFDEHGPFEINYYNYSQLDLRPYRWSNIANVLYLESPVGVGFSYSDNPSVDYKITDDSAANDNLAAVKTFFSLFPEYKQNNFFITGESYAGIYVPTLAEAILNDVAAGTYTGAPLNGIGVGNGCTGTEIGICGNGPQGTYYQWSYLLGLAFVSWDLKVKINTACDWESAKNNVPNSLSITCTNLLLEASKQIGNTNMYNVFGDCVNGDSCSSMGLQAGEHNPLLLSLSSARYTAFGPKACIDSRAISAYLNRADVQAAIHVVNPGRCWTECGTPTGWRYTSTRTNLPANTYPRLIDNLRVLIYNGDWDACVPYTDNESWTSDMGYADLNPWHLWTYTSTYGETGQVAGYAVNYVTGSSNPLSSFTFATVKGAGHLVPQQAPSQALEMLNRLLSGQSF